MADFVDGRRIPVPKVDPQSVENCLPHVSLLSPGDMSLLLSVRDQLAETGVLKKESFTFERMSDEELSEMMDESRRMSQNEDVFSPSTYVAPIVLSVVDLKDDLSFIDEFDEDDYTL